MRGKQSLVRCISFLNIIKKMLLAQDIFSINIKIDIISKKIL